MTIYGSDYLTRMVAAVDRFDEAFEQWMETQVESDHIESRGLFPTVWVKEGQDQVEVRRLELMVAEAAGETARAVAITGSYIAVAGLGAIDPVANWSLMSAPKALVSPHDIRMATASMRGRLRSMITDSEATQESDLPGFAPSELHPVIWTAAAAHWTTHHRRVAVREAAEALTIDWKKRLGRADVDGAEFWEQSLSKGEPEPQRPKIEWPGDPDDKTVRSMRAGLVKVARALAELATGLNSTVRNAATHSQTELSEQEAMERLAAYSYLARLLDQCEIRRAPPTSST